LRDIFDKKWGDERTGEIYHYCDLLPSERLMKLAFSRVWTERASNPIFSRYAQGLVDLSCSIRLIKNFEQSKDREKTAPDHRYCFEWDKSFVLNDKGWTLYTGMAIQDECDWPIPNRASSSIFETSSDEAPPLLLPGCHVIKGPNWDEGKYNEPRPSPESIALAQAAANAAASIPKLPPMPPSNKPKTGKGNLLWGRMQGAGRTAAIENMEAEVLAAMAAMDAEDELIKNDNNEPANTDSHADETGSAEENMVISGAFSGEFEESASSTDDDGIIDEMEENGGVSIKINEATSEGNATAENPQSSVPQTQNIKPSAIGVVEEIIEWNGNPGQGRRVRWPDGTVGNYRWGYAGRLDLTHVELSPDGSIRCKHHPPETREDAAISMGLGKKLHYGIILRLRPDPIPDNSFEKLEAETKNLKYIEGIIEWPDLDAAARVTGTEDENGIIIFEERELLWGSINSGWMCRFGKHEWQPGTKYEFKSESSKFSNSEKISKLSGTSSYNVEIGGNTARINIRFDLQNSLLFTLDPNRCASRIIISSDGKSARCNSNDGRCAVYGSVGFSKGIHYWEIKIEQAEPGYVFLGVAEAPSRGSPIGARLESWPGEGFVNYRAAYQGGSEKVYGEHFHSNDVVGVLLDMDHGSVSFFLDGMKFGEHVVANLGVAYDRLHGPRPRVIPTVMYPVIGLRKYGDSVSLTDKFISSPGVDTSVLLTSAVNVCESLHKWENADRTASPMDRLPIALTVEAWQHMKRWQSSNLFRATTRAGINARVDLDQSPTACFRASIQLDLTFPLFAGDTIMVKICEIPEKVQVLGVYMDKLWWRRSDGPRGGGTDILGENGVNAVWCWSTGDVKPEDLQIAKSLTTTPSNAHSISLEKLMINYDSKLKIISNEGLLFTTEIDIDSQKIIEQAAVGSFGVVENVGITNEGNVRYYVSIDSKKGWLSGLEGTFEFVLDHEVENTGETKTLELCSSISLKYALKAFEHFIINTNGSFGSMWLNCIGKQNEPEHKEKCEEMTFNEFVSLANKRFWSTEEDMQITEALNFVSDILGEEQANVSWYETMHLLIQLKKNQSVLCPISRELLDEASIMEIMGRMCIIRSFNLHVRISLPLLRLTLPEEDWWQRVGTSVNRLPHSDTVDETESIAKLTARWKPKCMARQLRYNRRLLLTETKMFFWDGVLTSTTTPTPLSHDEYEDPKEVRVVKLNRVRAAQSRLIQLRSPIERIRHSVFGQLQRELRSWPSSSLRRAYVGKGHGGQKRAFKVKFIGEGVNDYGGPYRAVFEQISQELQADEIKDSDGCLLPILVPVPNRSSKLGENQDKFALHPSFKDSPDLMNFFGRILGTGIRNGLQMDLDLAPTIWRPLVGLPLTNKHLESIDLLTAKRVQTLREIGVEQFSEGISETWEELTFTKFSSDGRLIELVPDGSSQHVDKENWKTYCTLTVAAGLHEGSQALQSFYAGLAAILPTELFPLFTDNELETMICGSKDMDVEMLQKCTEYSGVSSDAPHIVAFWDVLKEDFTAADRAAFLRFAWARSRLPKSVRDFPTSFKLQTSVIADGADPDTYLPHAQTCFFSLSIPKYSSREILRAKLLYAIANSPNMDRDIRLHNAEGW